MRLILQAIVVCLGLFLLPTSVCAKSKEEVQKEWAAMKEEMAIAKKNALEALAEADEVTLYSLTGATNFSADGKVDETPDSLRGHPLFGKTALTGDEAKAAVGAFRQAIENSSGAVAMCFFPHHALTFKAKNHTYDYVLCYECLQLEIYEDGKQLMTQAVGGNSTVLDGLLDEHNIQRKK